MEIEQLAPNKHEDWDKFCLQNDDAWFWHTTEWLYYTQNYRPDLKSKNLSFLLINNHKVIGICPLFLETTKIGDEETKELSFGGSPTPMPALENDLSESNREKRYKLIFENIDKLSQEYQASRVTIRASPLSPSYIQSNYSQNNILMKYGYIPISLNTQIIDLTKNQATLWADIRHGHAYDINRGMKYIQATAFDKNNLTKDVYTQYQQLHHKAAGRVTRPQITFDLMYSWILQGYATLFAATINKQYVGFSYVYTYKSAAYYGSACNDPDCSQEPIGHVLQWKTIQCLKDQGFKFYEIGWQNYASLPYCITSQKEVAISTFKRGFGGFSVPQFIGEKYYNSQYYLKINTERLKQYALTLQNSTVQASNP